MNGHARARAWGVGGCWGRGGGVRVCCVWFVQGFRGGSSWSGVFGEEEGGVGGRFYGGEGGLCVAPGKWKG